MKNSDGNSLLSSISAFVVGVIFAVGLGLSGMTQPHKVVGFLDLFGSWDPSLIFVMLGAIAVHFVAYRLIRLRKAPMFSSEWHVPEKRDITPSLMIGAFIFGAGWALAGYCPGPALTSLASGSSTAAVFVISMLVGMLGFRMVDKRLKIKK